MLTGDPDLRSFDFLLTVTDDRLELREPGSKAGPLSVDFVTGATAFRRKSGPSRRQPLGRAVGIKGEGCTVLDATAGLGRDAFLLACWGCEVVAVERSPVLYALLKDGWTRATTAGDEGLERIMERLRFFHRDARESLRTLRENDRPDVVYIDPMFPAKKKSALEGREIRVCRALVGADADADELFQAAGQAARNRVVVKRHRRAPLLAGQPDFAITGRSVRYDVYLVKQQP